MSRITLKWYRGHGYELMIDKHFYALTDEELTQLEIKISKAREHRKRMKAVEYKDHCSFPECTCNLEDNGRHTCRRNVRGYAIRSR